MSLDPISPLASSSLLGVGLDVGVWVCVMLGVECSVCRRMIDYHTRVILKQRTGAWRPPRARWLPSTCAKAPEKNRGGRLFFAGRVISLPSLHLVKTSSHSSQG